MSTSDDKKLILVVDDELVNTRLASSILREDYDIRTATSGEEALRLVQTAPIPDLILLDVNMPKIDGYQVCRSLKAQPQTRNIPVIFLTGQTQTTDETQGFEVGAVDYIHKPFSVAVMKARVRTHILLREAHEALSRQLRTINSELEMAREIQLSILPSDTPKLKGLNIAARYIPMSAVAGDFYDFITVDEKHLGILIADVSGHGLPAALIASMLKIALLAESKHASDPALVLAGLNESLFGKFRRHYVTAAYVYVDLEKNIVSYAGAGHPPLLVRRKQDGQARELEENGLFLGPFPEAAFSSMRLPVETGDRLLLYTDGILEFRNPANEEFGGDRLRHFLDAHPVLDADRLADALIGELWRWAEQSPGPSQLDDITILAVDITSH